MREVELQRRCDKNRKRSKRRTIYCPVHGCYIHSISQKYALFADQAGQLQERGVGREEAQILIASKTAITLKGEWLEAFWCDLCQETKWYHVTKRDRIYEVTNAPRELWQQAIGVMNPSGNPTVSEFTRRQSRMVGDRGIKDFRFVG